MQYPSPAGMAQALMHMAVLAPVGMAMAMASRRQPVAHMVDTAAQMETGMELHRLMVGQVQPGPADMVGRVAMGMGQEQQQEGMVGPVGLARMVGQVATQQAGTGRVGMVPMVLHQAVTAMAMAPLRLLVATMAGSHRPSHQGVMACMHPHRPTCLFPARRASLVARLLRSHQEARPASTCLGDHW